jgi:integrase
MVEQVLRDESDIRRITRERGDDLILENRPVKPAERVPANATANRHVATLSAMLNAAHEEWAWVEYAPSLRRYPEPEPVDVWLSVPEWRKLAVALPTHLARLATFALATGLRERKVFGLEWSQVNLKERWMGFKGTDNKLGNVIPLNQTAMAVLTEVAALPVRHRTSVFLYKGQPMKCYGKAWYKALVRAELGNWNEEREWHGFHWHGLRHTFATWLRHGGAPDWAIDALGGWSRSATRERYSHVAVEALRPHAAIIDTLLAQTNGQGSVQVVDPLVGRAGFEPATNGLKVRCSTN